MARRVVDLSAHLCDTAERGHPADFPVIIRRLYYSAGAGYGPGYVRNRVAIVRADTGDAIAIVSYRKPLMLHEVLLQLMQEAITKLKLGPAQRGIYVDRDGVTMRALFTFPALPQVVYPIGRDDVFPCVKITHSYDGASRMSVQLGAVRRHCANLAVGGGGVFSGAIISVHEKDTVVGKKITQQLRTQLSGFDAVVQMYRRWMQMRFDSDRIRSILSGLPRSASEPIGEGILTSGVETVYSAYNIATGHATRRMRGVRVAFDTLERINRGFQLHFSPE